MSGPAPTDGDARSPPLRVGTYNVRYAGLDEGATAWERRRGAVASTLRFHRPDAVALQECWQGQLEDLRDRLPGYEWIAHGDEHGAHTPIGYRPGRLDPVAEGGFGLAPGGERNVLAWDAVLPRYATRATFRDRVTGRRFGLVSVHLDHRGERAREMGARMVRERLTEGPAVVAGDLNCGPDAPPVGVLTRDLRDARPAADWRHGPAETYVGFDGPAAGSDGSGGSPGDAAPARLDYLLVRGFGVAGYGVAADVGPGWARPSDHLPAVATLSVPAGRADRGSDCGSI